MRFFSVPIPSNGPSYVFKHTAYKAEEGGNQTRVHFLSCEISERAADTQCAVASPLQVFQHPAFACQTTTLQSLSLTNTQRRSRFSQQEENKVGTDTHLVRCYHQQAPISHALQCQAAVPGTRPPLPSVGSTTVTHM